MKWLDTHLPGSVLGVAGGKRNWHTTAFCAKNRLATEPVRKQRAVVELSRAGGCIKEGKTVCPCELLTGPARPIYIRTSLCLPLSLSLSLSLSRSLSLSLLPALGKRRHSSTSALVTAVSEPSCVLQCAPFMFCLKGCSSQNILECNKLELSKLF